MRREPIAKRAQGRWRGILAGLGADASYLNGKHGPCPVCGGKDRFRFDDKDGKGTFFCNKCGAGDGMQLAQAITGKPFREAVQDVESQLGEARYEEPKPQITPDEQKQIIRKLWRSGRPLAAGDPAEAYLNGRGLSGLGDVSLRYVDECWHAESRANHPAMLAAVQAPGGTACAVHRTYLTLDGRKADVNPVRKLSAGTVPDGAAVRFGPVTETMGVAEGLETSKAARRLLMASGQNNVSVWSCLTRTLLEKWIPPEGVRNVIIYMDRDASFDGQKSAYILASRLAASGRFRVEDKMPMRVDEDWCDAWQAYRTENAA